MSKDNPRDEAWARYYANHPEVAATWSENNGRKPNCFCQNCDPLDLNAVKEIAQLSLRLPGRLR